MFSINPELLLSYRLLLLSFLRDFLLLKAIATQKKRNPWNPDF